LSVRDLSAEVPVTVPAFSGDTITVALFASTARIVPSTIVAS
jgi:hypothetical protein